MGQVENIETAKETLLSGGLVGMPTETVYGLAASIYSEEALRKVFQMKERPLFDPLIVHIYKLEQVKELVDSWPEAANILAREFWPGPLSLILPKNESVNELIVAGQKTVAIRMPEHPIARELLTAVNCPLAAPSANKFSKTSPTSYQHVKDAFPELLVLDGGNSMIGLESTVLGIDEQSKRLICYRPGMILKDDILSALSKQRLNYSFEYAESLVSPGNVKNHYMPAIPLFIFESDDFNEDKIKTICANYLDKNEVRGGEINLDSEVVIAARNLYKQLHEYSKSQAYDFLYVCKNESRSASSWMAIWDRLERAATKIIK